MKTKQERIEALAERIGSTAKTMAGLKKYYRTHKMLKKILIKSLQPYWDKVYYCHAPKGGYAEYKTKKICSHRPALKVVADRTDDLSKIKTRHSKYSRLSISGAGGTINYKGDYRGYRLSYSDATYRYATLPGGDQLCSIYTDRGKLAIELTVPGRLIPRLTKNSAPLLTDDIIGEKRHGIIVRYAPKKIDKNKYALEKSGIAVEFSDPTNQERKYWEHGATIRECRSEYARKIAIAEQERLQKITDAKKRRAISLIMRLVKTPVVSYGDARRAGACRAGIMSFAQRQNISLTGKQPLQIVVNAHQRTAYMVADKLAQCVIH